jgi:hypothetical protein
MGEGGRSWRMEAGLEGDAVGVKEVSEPDEEGESMDIMVADCR